MTDCAREYSHADVAVQNSGGIRADLPAGPVTLREIYDIMPFDNYVTDLTMDGGLVKDMLDHGVNKEKGMIQVSGAAFGYDRDAADGGRLTNATIGGKPLDPKASYKVVTLDFLVRGGDGYTPFGRAQGKDFTQVLWRDMLTRCAQRQKTIVPPAMGRMTPNRNGQAAAGGKSGP
jgi:2',3'-cyclic-nucleotide 2'-phosphodiesterase (5'-nucleotidase family)